MSWDVSGAVLSLVMPCVSRAPRGVEWVKCTRQTDPPTREVQSTVLDDAPAAQQRPRQMPEIAAMALVPIWMSTWHCLSPSDT